MAWTADFMLQVFRSLGGRAENVRLKDASEGIGLVPINPQNPVVVHAPAHLAVPVSEVEFVDGRLRIKESAPIGSGERTFFENYYDTFSWGGPGRVQAMAFVSGMRALPQDVKEYLSRDFSLGPMVAGTSEEAEKAAQQWFLQNRQFGRAGQVLLPVVELVNHDAAAAPVEDHEGIWVRGTFETEVVALRRRSGPLGTFWQVGFPSPERVAYSLPVQVDSEAGRVEVEGPFRPGSRIGGIPVPEYRVEDNVVKISGLMIGNSQGPRIPRGLFDHIMKEVGRPNDDETFDRILHWNRMIVLGLLAVLEPHDGGLVPALRKAARYQLEAMSWCFGSREL